MHFNLVDILVLGYAGFSAARGRRRGVAVELPWAISWAVALFTGSGIYRWTSRGLESVSQVTGVTFGLLGFVAVLVGAYFMVRKLRSRMRQLAEKRVTEEETRKRWGAAVGGLRALLFCSFLILFISLLPIGILKKPFTEGSLVGRVMMAIARPAYALTHRHPTSR